MSFSFLGSLASLLPGYVQGQRMANQDNWNDLNQYNKVQEGQLANAFLEATWTPRVNQYWWNNLNNAMGVWGNSIDLAQKTMEAPGNLIQANARSSYMPWIADDQNRAIMEMYQRAGLMGGLGMGRNGGLPASLGG